VLSLSHPFFFSSRKEEISLSLPLLSPSFLRPEKEVKEEEKVKDATQKMEKMKERETRRKTMRRKVFFCLRQKKRRIVCAVERKSWNAKEMMVVMMSDHRVEGKKKRKRCVVGCTIRRKSEDKEGSLRGS